MNLDFLLPHIAHFHNTIVLPLLVFETLGFMFSVFFLHFKQYDFIFICSYMYLLFQTVIYNFITLNNFINTYISTFFNQTNLFSVTYMTIHHSNAFFQFSIFFFFINNCLKVFMTNFIIHQCFRYFFFYAI